MNVDLEQSLHDLATYSACASEPRDCRYLAETKTELAVMRYNTRYVSNVTVGYCMKRTTHRNRLCPYVLPIRHRTKSENSEAIEAADAEFKNGGFVQPSSGVCRDINKRCQSLENLNLSVEAPPPDTSPDMERVSTQIQKLQVDE